MVGVPYSAQNLLQRARGLGRFSTGQFTGLSLPIPGSTHLRKSRPKQRTPVDCGTVSLCDDRHGEFFLCVVHPTILQGKFEQHVPLGDDGVITLALGEARILDRVERARLAEWRRRKNRRACRMNLRQGGCV